jgi:hypothetical protein
LSVHPPFRNGESEEALGSHKGKIVPRLMRNMFFLVRSMLVGGVKMGSLFRCFKNFFDFRWQYVKRMFIFVAEL